MAEIQMFENSAFGSVRTIEENGKVLFCGKDIAVALGYENPSKAVRDHCRADGGPKRYPIVDSLGRRQEATFISEGDVYRLITHSKLQAAEQFEHWVFDEVLPSIRRHGMYAVDDLLNDPDLAIQAFTALKEERAKNNVLQIENAQQKQIIGELKPRADYTDRILSNPGLVTITQIAKDYGMSGRTLNKILADLGVQYKQSGQWLLYAKYHDAGYTHSKTIDITRSDGRNDVVMETKWTQKGRLFVYELLKSEGILPIIEKNIA